MVGTRAPQFKVICGDEFAIAFQQFREDASYVILVVWGEPFAGKVA